MPLTETSHAIRQQQIQVRRRLADIKLIIDVDDTRGESAVICRRRSISELAICSYTRSGLGKLAKCWNSIKLSGWD